MFDFFSKIGTIYTIPKTIVKQVFWMFFYMDSFYFNELFKKNKCSIKKLSQ